MANGGRRQWAAEGTLAAVTEQGVGDGNRGHKREAEHPMTALEQLKVTMDRHLVQEEDGGAVCVRETCGRTEKAGKSHEMMLW